MLLELLQHSSKITGKPFGDLNLLLLKYINVQILLFLHCKSAWVTPIFVLLLCDFVNGGRAFSFPIN